MRCTLYRGIAREPCIRATVEIGANLARDDAAVAHHAIRDIDALGAARRAILHFLLTPKYVTHRPSGQHCRENGERLGDGIDLAAESAAHRAADEVEGV